MAHLLKYSKSASKISTTERIFCSSISGEPFLFSNLLIFKNVSYFSFDIKGYIYRTTILFIIKVHYYSLSKFDESFDSIIHVIFYPQNIKILAIETKKQDHWKVISCLAKNSAFSGCLYVFFNRMMSWIGSILRYTAGFGGC